MLWWQISVIFTWYACQVLVHGLRLGRRGEILRIGRVNKIKHPLIDKGRLRRSLSLRLRRVDGLYSILFLSQF